MSYRERAEIFCRRFGLARPVLLAPMAGACPPRLSIAVADAGGLGACGALLMAPHEIAQWAGVVRTQTDGGFQINLWIPGPSPKRDPAHESRVREFLGGWGPEVPADTGEKAPPDFHEQSEALIAARPAAASSIMGLFPARYVRRLKHQGIAWFAVATTVGDALAAEAAGADVIVAQGMEAGGHRGAFDPARAERELVGLVSLVPAIVDAVKVPVVATGGIADGRGVAAAFALGASAVQIGTAFLRCPEADIPRAWTDALGRTRPEETVVSRVFSGKPGRSIATAYVKAATSAEAPPPAPYPVQRALTAPMRKAAAAAGDVERMQAWAGQSAALGRAMPAGELVEQLWSDAQVLLQA
ncbi:MAG TPA: nitronate monooxygenase [Rhizomicrobium sp.]|nr:nitronate monooxygenase [Rhizomicrobium sp.]